MNCCCSCYIPVNLVGLHLENLTRLKHTYVAAEVLETYSIFIRQGKKESLSSVFLISDIPVFVGLTLTKYTLTKSAVMLCLIHHSVMFCCCLPGVITCLSILSL